MVRQTISRLEQASALDPVSDRLQGAVRSVFQPRRLRDALHGTWLGHPLHPVLVDWSGLSRDQRRVGLVHAAANVVALGLYAGSLAARFAGRRGLGKILGYAGLSIAGAGAYLGGHLSYEQGAQMNHGSSEVLRLPGDWAEIGEVAALPEGSPTVRTIGDVRVLLYRLGDEVTAMVERCGHAGGPLGEGRVEGTGENACVVCPWHESTFRLKDGLVLHGPAGGDQPTLRTRIRDGVLTVATP